MQMENVLSVTKFGYKKGKLLEEYFLNPHFKPTPEEQKELDEFFNKKPLTKDAEGGTIRLSN